ncbi:hypothetical protein H0X06_03090 [Candidatus Dependentiae bacterium]|nr:hypothetical protein [Candidatus Dependentiae bacterium]
MKRVLLLTMVFLISSIASAMDQDKTSVFKMTAINNHSYYGKATVKVTIDKKGLLQLWDLTTGLVLENLDWNRLLLNVNKMYISPAIYNSSGKNEVVVCSSWGSLERRYPIDTWCGPRESTLMASLDISGLFLQLFDIKTNELLGSWNRAQMGNVYGLYFSYKGSDLSITNPFFHYPQPVLRVSHSLEKVFLDSSESQEKKFRKVTVAYDKPVLSEEEKSILKIVVIDGSTLIATVDSESRHLQLWHISTGSMLGSWDRSSLPEDIGEILFKCDGDELLVRNPFYIQREF